MNSTEQEECVITGDTEEKKDNLLLIDITKEKKVSGIYSIRNKVNGMIYIGSSNNIKRDRWKEHRWLLKNNKHTNPHLQNAWNKYGEKNFEFLIEEILPIEKLKIVEQQYLDMIKNLPEKRIRYYNISFDSTCPARGIKHTSEYKINMSRILKGKKKKPFSDEHKLNLSKSKIGKSIWPNGRTFSKESKKKMSDSKLGKCGGNKNPAFDKKIYTFKHLKTHEIFTGTRYDFYTKFDLKNQISHISQLINGKRNRVKDWILIV